MPLPGEHQGGLRVRPAAAYTTIGPLRRLLFAFVGILAGNAALLLYLLPHALQLFTLYAIFSLVGWAFVGLPIVLPFPPRILSRLAWPVYLLIGAVLGPLALLLIFVAMFALQGRLSTFSLAHSESFWPFSILVSTVSFGVYAVLVRRRTRRENP